MTTRQRKRAKRRERSTQDFLGMVGRMMRAAGRRVGMEDEFELAELIGLREQLDEAIADAVAGQREYGKKSWSAIAAATGTTRQGAQQRWGKRKAA